MSTHDVLDRRVYGPGEVIFKEGEVSRRCAYLVEKGTVEICKAGPDGQVRTLGMVGAGGIFGEMALVDNKPRMGMARAVDSASVIIITAAVFEEKLRRSDPFIRGLLNIFVRNIRDLTDKWMNTPS